VQDANRAAEVPIFADACHTTLALILSSRRNIGYFQLLTTAFWKLEGISVVRVHPPEFDIFASADLVLLRSAQVWRHQLS
jgi:hypothetical protein